MRPATLDAGAVALDECKSRPRIVRRQVAHLECPECLHRWTLCVPSRGVGRFTFERTRCPVCHSYDTEVF